MGRLEVTAAVAVLPTTDGREQYLYRGAIVDSDAFTEKGLEHARAQGLIGDAPEPVEEEAPALVFTQQDVDAAVKAATEAQAAELTKAIAERDAAKAELNASKTPPAKPSAAKQS